MSDDSAQYIPPWKLPPEDSENHKPQVLQPSTQNEKPTTKLKLKWVLAIIGTLVLLVFAFFGFILFQGLKDAPKVPSKVTFFIQYVSNNDLESARNLTSKEFEKLISTYKYQYSDFEK